MGKKSILQRSMTLFHRRVPSVYIVLGVLLVQLLSGVVRVSTLVVAFMVISFIAFRHRQALSSWRRGRKGMIGLTLGLIPLLISARSTIFELPSHFSVVVTAQPVSRIADQITFIGKVIDNSSLSLWRKETNVQITSVLLPWRNSDKIVEGSVVEVRGNFHKVDDDLFGSRGFKKRKGIDFQGKADFISVPIAQGTDLRGEITSRLFSRIDLLSEQLPIGSALLGSMILGVPSNVPPWIEELYKDTSLMHLLVISGMQISLLHLVILMFFKVIGKIISTFIFTRWKRSVEDYAPLAALGVILSYVYLIGMEDAAFRAFIAISIAVVGRRYGFKVGVLQVTLSMVILSFLFHPLCIFDLSFQLTTGALLGISLGLFASGGISAARWRSALCATIGATSVTSLICLAHFQTIATWGIFYNLLFAWPVSLISCTVGIPALLIDTVLGKTIFSYFSAGGLQVITYALESLFSILPFQSNQTLGLGISLMVLVFLISQSVMRILREVVRGG